MSTAHAQQVPELTVCRCRRKGVEAMSPALDIPRLKGPLLESRDRRLWNVISITIVRCNLAIHQPQQPEKNNDALPSRQRPAVYRSGRR
jgi:hypothetical protein